MHKEGHIGLGLLLYSPLAFWFVDLGWTMAFGLGMIAFGAWSFLPDVDMTLPIRHRGPTHSVVFALFAGVLTAAGFGWLASQGAFDLPGVSPPWLFVSLAVGIGFVSGFGGVIAHILGDVLTPMGVRPFWPRSDREYSLNLVLAADEEANRQLSFIGAVALTAALVLAKMM